MNAADPTVVENRKESCKTYLEQTKLLVTLASAFLLPPAFVHIVAGVGEIKLLMACVFCLVFSIFCGYVVFGTIAGSQRQGEYDVYRLATMSWSILQIIAFLGGLVLFVWMCTQLDRDVDRAAEVKEAFSQPLEAKDSSAKRDN